MSLNKVMLIGNVGKEPEIHYTSQSVCTAQFPLATTTRGYTLANGTNVPERTEWHNILLWRKLAEVAERYVHKGDKLYIEGEIRTRSYTDKKGFTRYVTEIWGNQMEILSPKTQNAAPAAGGAANTSHEDDLPSAEDDKLPF